MIGHGARHRSTAPPRWLPRHLAWVVAAVMAGALVTAVASVADPEPSESEPTTALASAYDGCLSAVRLALESSGLGAEPTAFLRHREPDPRAPERTLIRNPFLGTHRSGVATFTALSCVLRETGAPTQVRNAVRMSSPQDGPGQASWDGLSLRWTRQDRGVRATIVAEDSGGRSAPTDPL